MTISVSTKLMSSQFFAATQPTLKSQEQNKKSVGTGIQFCPECNNMLVPKADQQEGVLKYICHNCSYEKVAESNRVYINVLKRTSEQSYLTRSCISSDPTLKRNYATCPECGQYCECVFFFAPTLAGEESLTEMMECTNCKYQWSNTN